MSQRKTASKTKKGTARSSAKAASRKTKSSFGKSNASKPARAAGEEVVTVDRRRVPRRQNESQQAAAGEKVVPSVPLERRKKVNRRRQIDPTTCERDYTDDEIQFMSALDNYKRTSGRMFPTCSEVLEVVRSLGYVRLLPSEVAASAEADPMVQPPCDSGHLHSTDDLFANEPQ